MLLLQCKFFTTAQSFGAALHGIFFCYQPNFMFLTPSATPPATVCHPPATLTDPLSHHPCHLHPRCTTGTHSMHSALIHNIAVQFIALQCNALNLNILQCTAIPCLALHNLALHYTEMSAAYLSPPSPDLPAPRLSQDDA